MYRFTLVCLGSALGGGLRYGVALWAPRALGAGFPWATLLVNTVGSFLIGLIMYMGLQGRMFSDDMRFALTTGVMGGLTTYSSFNYETLNLLRAGSWGVGLANITVTLLGCLGLGMLGLAAGRWVVGS